ncbi:hypothetical protein J6P92_04810 [bacterium]|nr:hypothetical protein [bacterium]
MKTQAISNQNFNGNLYFVEKAGQKAKEPLREHIIKRIGKRGMETINSLIKDKPYDIFVSRSEINPEILYVEADKSFVDAVKNRPQKGYREWFSEGSIRWFPHSIKSVMENYENFAARAQAKTEEISKSYILKPYKKN